MSRASHDFLNGVPEMLVLQILSEREFYGYELVRMIRLRSGERLQFGEGSIYPILHALTAEGELKMRQETAGGRQRYYYRTTAKGKKRLAMMTLRWQSVAKGIGLTLGGQHA